LFTDGAGVGVALPLGVDSQEPFVHALFVKFVTARDQGPELFKWLKNVEADRTDKRGTTAIGAAGVIFCIFIFKR
jgi:hypothetical protein